MDDPEFWDHYFIDYFGNIVRLGTVGIHRQYNIQDYYGMNKANAMDIANSQYDSHTTIVEPTFEEWFQTMKYSSFYNAIYIYLFDPYHNTPQKVEEWFYMYYLVFKID